MLYLCTWKDDDEAFLVDAADAGAARAIAKTEASEAPEDVKEIPHSFFAAWVRLGDPESDPEEWEDRLILEPLDHVDSTLVTLAGLAVDDDDASDEPPCGATGELDDGELVTCTEPHDHEPPHRKRVGAAVVAQWEDE